MGSSLEGATGMQHFPRTGMQSGGWTGAPRVTPGRLLRFIRAKMRSDGTTDWLAHIAAGRIKVR